MSCKGGFKYICTCHRKKFSTVKPGGSIPGRLADDQNQYGVWAYWCGGTRNGWHAKPCAHSLGTFHEKDYTFHNNLGKS